MPTWSFFNNSRGQREVICNLSQIINVEINIIKQHNLFFMYASAFAFNFNQSNLHISVSVNISVQLFAGKQKQDTTHIYYN